MGTRPPRLALECSGDVERAPRKHFDIHGGGQDLQFPHHENESRNRKAHNAQVRQLLGCTTALGIDNEKMSKSLGNFFTYGKTRYIEQEISWRQEKAPRWCGFLLSARIIAVRELFRPAP